MRKNKTKSKNINDIQEIFDSLACKGNKPSDIVIAMHNAFCHANIFAKYTGDTKVYCGEGDIYLKDIINNFDEIIELSQRIENEE